MKKIYSIIVTLLLSLFCGYAQEMSVQSFVLAETDLTANTHGTMVHDQNGNVCALIKVETSHDGFTFDVGSLGVSDVKRVGGEIWVYVPFGVRRITVSHQQLGVIRDYQFPCAIEKGRTYIMKLTTGNVRTIVEQAPTKQYLVIQLDPSYATLEINGKMKVTDNGVYQELLPYGRYQYKAYYSDYHDIVGIVELSDKKQSLNLNLKAAFGHLSVLDDSRSAYAGATVYVDGQMVGKIPVRNYKLSSGSHEIRIMKEMYEPYVQTITISDEENRQFVPDMVPDFAEVTLSTVGGADIYINGEPRGKGRWSGRLASGSYVLETRQDGHIPYKMSYDISRNDHNRTIDVPGPIPMYGSLVISSTPINARVYVGSEHVGETPLYIPKQLVGTHTVSVELEGYAKQTQMIEVTEGAEASLSFELKKQETAVAVAPAAGLDTSSGSGTGDFVLNIKGVEYPMVFVEGGTFRMGSNDKEASSEAKPVHNVTLSNYHIGKYEVTQELWEAVMGSNPSSFKGARRPVETVSWNECQEFIRKLNNLTGKNFKLPTEAQWEYAARGGKKSRGYKYSGSNNIDDVAWYSQNSRKKTHVVGAKNPNELGIHDMNGNVTEWCNDWYASYDYSSQTNPSGPSSGSSRVNRGCGFNDGGIYHHVSKRYHTYGGNHFNSFGFRLCL